MSRSEGIAGNELFDLSDEYEQMLDQGIRLSGESMLFFLEHRLQLVRRRLQGRGAIRRILDFGCGLGYASVRLAALFPGSEVVGADTSENALAAARMRNGGPAVTFCTVRELENWPGNFDLCYVNGVFHHIPPPERSAALELIRNLLRPGGMFALFENNPWNIGARMVMARIPFDRDAIMMSPLETASLLRRVGFSVARTDSLFFFPRQLKMLRPLEPRLSWTRLGAQYMTLGERM